MACNSIWHFIADVLAQGEDVCLVTMVHAEGAGPNRPGARMAVTAEGQRCGTVGGGRSEFDLAELARAAVNAGARPAAEVITMDHRDVDGASGSGMICSGTQWFVLICLTPADLTTIERIAQTWHHGSRGLLTLTCNGIAFDESVSTGSTTAFDADEWRYSQVVGLRDTVTLVGGGHVSLALSALLHGLEMRVVVLDNRSDLATMKENMFADDLKVIDYSNVQDHIPTGKNSYVCIMTFGHKHDEEVLERIVERPLRYLGMMGSARKIEQIWGNLLARGISAQSLDRVHAPIGLPIGSNTPAEIAVSIAAQIVRVRNA